MRKTTRQLDMEDLEDIAAELVQGFDEVIQRYDTADRGDDVLNELKQLRYYASTILGKLPKIQKLRDFKGYKFAVFDEGATEPRQATYDESMRLIMGYKKGNILDIMQEWTVINSQWVKRPLTNPDGSTVK